MRKISARIFHNSKLIANQSIDVSPVIGSLIRYGDNIICKVNEITICLDETPNADGQTRLNISCVDENPENRIGGLLNQLQFIRKQANMIGGCQANHSIAYEIDSVCTDLEAEIENGTVNFYGKA